MFGRQLKLKQARHALQDGRLEEAFTIVTHADVRDHRVAQEILDDLVTPLLERATAHLEAGRLEEALVDIERAVDAGGNRPEAATQRRAVLEALRKRKKEEHRMGSLLDSARRHLNNGSLHTTKQRLDEAPQDDSRVPELRKQTEERERKGAEANNRARAHLEGEEIFEAIDAAQETLRSWGRDERTHALLADLKRRSIRVLLAAFESGDLRLASALQGRMREVMDDCVELRRFDDALSLSVEAQKAFSQNDYESARLRLGRLDKLFPGVTWIADALGDLTGVSEGLRSLRSGPVGDLGSSSFSLSLNDKTLHNGEALSMQVTPEIPKPEPRARHSEHESPPATGERRTLLWIDGLGTYLILPKNRICLGRLGSTSHPDVSLTADIAGYHAEVQRLGEDYFVSAVQGDIRIGGKKVQKKLLAHNDTIELGGRCKLRFRQPTGLSATALLDLRQGMRVEGDVQTIVLLDDNLIIGPGSNCHIQAPTLEKRFVIQNGTEGLLCRAEKDILVDGRASGPQALIEPGAHIQVEDLTFTVTSESVR